jgi:hypothetical protein
MVLGACGESTDRDVRTPADTPAPSETTQPTKSVPPTEATALEQTETTPLTELTAPPIETTSSAETAPPIETTPSTEPTAPERTATTTTEPPPTAASAVTTTLPEEECFGPCPRQDDTLGVVGIAFDELLTLRVAPATDEMVVGALPPLTEVVATGDNRATWYEVTANGQTGWAPRANLLALDGTFDLTAGIVSSLGSLPRASSMLELGMIVTDVVVPCDPATPTTIVVVVAPTPGLVSEVVYDTFTGEMCGDDSIAGERIRVTGQQVENSELPANGFARALVYELVSVESRYICWRGSDGTLCV